MQAEKRTLKQILSYLLVGGGTALLELVVFQLLYSFTALGPSWSNIVAVVISTTCNFILNGTVTFRSSSSLGRSITLYCLLFAFNTAFSTTVITLCANGGIPPLAAKVVTMACIVCWNFILYRKVVFK